MIVLDEPNLLKQVYHPCNLNAYIYLSGARMPGFQKAVNQLWILCLSSCSSWYHCVPTGFKLHQGVLRINRFGLALPSLMGS
jgi:hypothetical protein